MIRIRTAVISLIMSMSLGACGGGGNGGDAGSGPVHVAQDPGEQWTLTAPADLGLDASLLNQAVTSLPSNHGLASMLVLRHGKPAFERYWNGYDENSLHDLRSATKSITSLLVGIALDQHLLGSVNDPISTYLSAVYPNAPALKNGLTLDNLLTMRSGLACNDWITGSPGNESNMYLQTDWVQFYLNLPQAYTPGTTTQYCTGNPVALGRVLAETSRQNIPTFANAKLFGPLGIKTAQWASFDNELQTDTGGHIKLRPRDMSKIGQLVLQNGQWNGSQIVSSAWIAQSTSPHTTFDSNNPRSGYGYLWWRSVEQYGSQSVNMVYADGNGGQYIFLFPSLDMVVVFTGENYDSDRQNLPFDLLDQYILPAVK